VGVLAVTLTARLLKGIDLFEPWVVQTVTVLAVVTAVARVLNLRKELRPNWPRAHALLYVFSFAAVLPIAVKQGLNGFSTNDEIYSWNMWAIQHAQGETIDLSYTRAPYPQSFSYLIAWCYQVLGSTDLQLPVKAAFATLSGAAMAAIGVVGRANNIRYAASAVVLILYLLYAADVYETLSTGLAETLMIPALTVSVALYLIFDHRRDSKSLLLCAVTALLAGLSKQPALIWLMLVLPLLSTATIYRAQEPLAILWPVAVAWLGGLAWLLTEGLGFQENQGVVSASIQDRTLLEQLQHAAATHIIGEPAFALILLAAGFSVHRTGTGRGIFWLLLVPSLVAWFIWGAYNTRLGVHVVMLGALLVAASGFGGLLGQQRSTRPNSTRVFTLAVAALCVISLAYSFLDARKELEARNPAFSLYDSPSNVIRKFFGPAAPSVLQQVFRNPEEVVWAGTNYVYGIFFSHNPLVRPTAVRLTAPELKQSLLHREATIIVDDGDLARVSLSAAALRELVGSCPGAFELLAESPVSYHYRLYRINRAELEECRT
jgi:hypothetical protein